MGATSSRLPEAGADGYYDGSGYPERQSGRSQHAPHNWQRRGGSGLGSGQGLSDAENGYVLRHVHRGPGDLYPSDDGTDSSDNDSEYESMSEDDEYAEADELYEDEGDNHTVGGEHGGPYGRRGPGGGGQTNHLRRGSHRHPRHQHQHHRQHRGTDFNGGGDGGGGGGWAMMRALDTVAARMRPAFSSSFGRARSAFTGASRPSFQASSYQHPQRHQRYLYATRNSRQSHLQNNGTGRGGGGDSDDRRRRRHQRQRRFGYGQRRPGNYQREVRHGYDHHPIYFGPAFRPVVEQSPEQVQLQRLLEHQLEQQQRDELQRRRDRQQRRQQQQRMEQLQHQRTSQDAAAMAASPGGPYPSQHHTSANTTAPAALTQSQHIQKDKLLYYRNNHLYNLISGLSVNPLLTEVQKAGTVDLKSLEQELRDVEGGWVDMDDDEETDEDRQELNEEEESLRKQGIAREMQPTKRSPTALACPVNLKKSTIRLVKNLSPLSSSKNASGNANSNHRAAPETAPAFAGVGGYTEPGAGIGTAGGDGGCHHHVQPPQGAAATPPPFQQSVLGLPSYRLDFMFDSQTPCDIKLFWVTKEVEELILMAPEEEEGEQGDDEDQTMVFLGFRLKRLFHLPQPTVYHFDAGLNQRFVSPILPLYNLSLPELTMQGLPSAAMRMLEKQRNREERRLRRRQKQLEQRQQRSQQRGAPRSSHGGAGTGTGRGAHWEEAEYLVDVDQNGAGELGHSADVWETDSDDDQSGLDSSSDVSLNKTGPGKGRSSYSHKMLPIEDQYYPLIIVIESKKQAGDPRDSKTLACDTPGLYLVENQAISTFCSFHISTEGGFELKVMKQKVWMNSNHYLIQEIYGFTDATPNTTAATPGSDPSPSPIPTQHSPSVTASAGASLPMPPAPAALMRDSAGGGDIPHSPSYHPPVTPTSRSNVQGLGIMEDGSDREELLPQFTRTSATPLSAEEYREQQAMEAKAKRLSRSLSRQSRAESVMTRMTELLGDSASVLTTAAAEPSATSTCVLQDSALPRPSWESQHIDELRVEEDTGSLASLSVSSSASPSHALDGLGNEQESKDKGPHEDSIVRHRYSASTLLGSEAPSSPSHSRTGTAGVASEESSLLVVSGHLSPLLHGEVRHRLSTSSMGSTAAGDHGIESHTPMRTNSGDDGGHCEGELSRNDVGHNPAIGIGAMASDQPLHHQQQPDLAEQQPPEQQQQQQQQQAQPQVNTVLLDAPECVICLSDVKDTLVLPCRHFCICNECADVLRRRTPQRCPICRQEFHALIHLASLPANKQYFFESERPSIEEEEEDEERDREARVDAQQQRHPQPHQQYYHHQQQHHLAHNEGEENGHQRYQLPMPIFAQDHTSLSSSHTIAT
ncbi:hypothetical protein DFQ27_001918 [Actinomortierella ambigua]|uniref:RING-type domain-containing protein n=1 Tax=Actinomortierella ambigua TaxID=1343610 RepID=A0A9P6QAQ0_9FUNG|nr:hypothetical protein DFQ27_001918 [Actinomortierella ambigua]